jgi:hypothetical protein
MMYAAPRLTRPLHLMNRRMFRDVRTTVIVRAGSQVNGGR